MGVETGKRGRGGGKGKEGIMAQQGKVKRDRLGRE